MTGTRIRSILVLAICAGIAFLSSVQALRMAAWRSDPVAAAAGLLPSGEARGAIAETLLTRQLVSGDGKLDGPVSAEAIAMAKDALRIDPLNNDALIVLAFAKAAEGRDDEARELFGTINTIAKRDRKANVWLAEDNLRNGRIAPALRNFDLLLRGGEEARDQVLPIIVEALRQEPLLPAMRDLLRDDPPWAGRFWQIASQSGPALPNIARLRRSLPADYPAMADVDEQAMVSRLVMMKEFAEARRVARYLGGEASAGLVSDPGFDRAPRFPPLDWQVMNEGEFGATIYQADGVMAVNALPGSFGLFARQVIQLPARPVRLAIELENALPDGVQLAGWIRCDGRPVPAKRLTLGPGARDGSMDFTPGCPVGLLELQVRTGQDAREAEIGIEEVRLQPL